MKPPRGVSVAAGSCDRDRRLVYPRVSGRGETSPSVLGGDQVGDCRLSRGSRGVSGVLGDNGYGGNGRLKTDRYDDGGRSLSGAAFGHYSATRDNEFTTTNDTYEVSSLGNRESQCYFLRCKSLSIFCVDTELIY